MHDIEKKQSTQSITSVRLLRITPLGILNDLYPDGVPVAPTTISINGWECYEFDPGLLSEEEDKALVAGAFLSEDYPLILCLGTINYGSVAIPIEWCEVRR